MFTFCFHAQMGGKITFLPSYKNGHRMTSRDIARRKFLYLQQMLKFASKEFILEFELLSLL